MLEQLHPKSNPPGEGGDLGGNGGNQLGFAGKYRKLDLPLFEGTNPDGWILRLERYFFFYRLSEVERMEAAVVALEGDALIWYQFEHRRRPIRSWEEMKLLMLRQFRSTSSGSLYEQWLSHQQSGDFAAYKRRFIELLAPLEEVSEEVALGQFIKGLEEDVKLEVRAFDPKTLEGAMELAGRLAEKWIKQNPGPKRDNHSFSKPNYRTTLYSSTSTHTLTNSPSHNPSHPNKTQTPSSTLTPTITKTQNTPPPSITASNHRQFRRLSDRELQEKREKGLCFRCDGKWGAGHVCHKKELAVLLMASDETAEGEGLDDEVLEEEVLHAQVSMSSMLGISRPKTMKLKGVIQGTIVIVLIDPGATHNFISSEIVKKLELPVTQTRAFEVSMGNGELVKGKGECKSLKLGVKGGHDSGRFLSFHSGDVGCYFGGTVAGEIRRSDK